MRKARSDVVDRSKSGIYHVYCRCVRRAFLMGKNDKSGTDFSHRRKWAKERVEHLAAYFAIDVFFVAFLSNHFHLILRNLPQQVEGWSDEDVTRRSCQIYPYKFKRLGVKNGVLTDTQLKEFQRDKELVKTLRKRLSDPSWFVRQLNQNIARRANDEDDCTGHFFQGRFEAEPISSLFMLLICGLYVDLNEYASGLSSSIEDSTGSSAYFRLRGRERRNRGDSGVDEEDGFLCPLFREEEATSDDGGDGRRASNVGVFEFTLDQYLDCLRLLMTQLDEARKLARKEGKADSKPPISKDDVADLLRGQDAFVAIASDFGD